MHQRRWRATAPARLPGALMLAALVPLAGCGGSGADGPANVQATPKATVVLTDGAYRPARVRIGVGSRVTFVNRSEVPNTAETGGIDTLEADRAALDRQNRFDLHTFRQGEAESVAFDTPGTYRFHSSLNSRMKGVVEVVARPD